jgi:hypothetical protein
MAGPCRAGWRSRQISSGGQRDVAGERRRDAPRCALVRGAWGYRAQPSSFDERDEARCCWCWAGAAPIEDCANSLHGKRAR